MSFLKIDTNKIRENVRKINEFMAKKEKKWTLVLKVLAGHREALENILHDQTVKNLHSVADSRISSLKMVKSINPETTTMYIKPPTVKSAKNVVTCADISLNSSKKTIEALNREAKKQDKRHKVIIMIELGELREGILRENTVDFYSKIFKLSNIEVIGLGTNLGCMYGIEPTYDKLMQLYLYKELIQSKFKKNLEIISGGSSITLPLIKGNKIPIGINHFRIGEAAFLGTSPYGNKKFSNLSSDAFSFYANIIELERKQTKPDGVYCNGNVGHAVKTDGNDEVEHHYRAILDFGALEVDGEKDLEPVNAWTKFIGTTSDMTVYDIGTDKKQLGVGDTIRFKPGYMGVARLMSSKFVSKIIVNNNDVPTA